MKRLLAWLRLWPLGTGPLRIREVGPHEHVYRPVIVREWGGDRLPFELIAGYRCRCGQPKPRPRYTPSDHVRAALRYWRERERRSWLP